MVYGTSIEFAFTPERMPSTCPASRATGHSFLLMVDTESTMSAARRYQNVFHFLSPSYCFQSEMGTNTYDLWKKTL